MSLRIWSLVLCFLVGLAAPGRADEDFLAQFDQTVVAAAQAGDPFKALVLADTITQLGWTEDNLRAALPFSRTAYRNSDQLQGENRRWYPYAALQLGRILAGLSEYRGSLDLSVEAEKRYRAIAEKLGDPMQMFSAGVAMEDQAITLQHLSRYDESIVLLEAAREIYESMPTPDEFAIANSWLNQGVGHEGAKDLFAALIAYGASLEMFSRIRGENSIEVGYLSNNIAWVLIQRDEFSDARGWLADAYKIIAAEEGEFSANLTTVKINMGLVSLEEGNYDEAVSWGMKAMPYIAANRSQTLDDQRWNFENLQRAFAAKGDIDRAIFFGKLAVNAQQEMRAANTVTGAEDMAASQAEWRRLYRALADLLIAQGRISEAQAVLNMEKEQEVFEFLKRDASADITDTRATLTPGEQGQETALAALVATPVALERELQSLMTKVEAGTATAAEEDRIFELQDALQAAADEFDAAVASFLAAAPAKQQQAFADQFDAVGSYQAVLAELPRKTAILQIAALDDTTHLFLTLPGVTQHAEAAIPQTELSRQIFEALQAIEAVSPEAETRLQTLYATLFAPVDQTLRDSGTEVVMLNLEGVLRYVPFAALHDGQGWLVQRYAFTLYSPAVPTQFETAARQPDATAGFGVTAAHPGFSALPGVAAELDTIFAPGTGVLAGQTALDAGFDERSLKKALLGKPTILHIASHFNLVPGREDDSFLLLGDGSHLPLSRIRQTRALRFTGVDLLTLSACQTARGGDGAEIDGFGATAQLNGAGAVMASLWPVSDAATPRLMRDFYAAMIGQGADKAESLRQAQLAMIGKGRAATQVASRAAAPLDGEAPASPAGLDHPYFWAAFVLMGNWL